MMYQCLFIVLLCAYGVFSDCDGENHSVKFGERKNGDKLVYTEHIEEDFKFLRKVVKTFKYPSSDEASSSKLISLIEVEDLFTNGNGGCATLKSGGPGFNFTSIKLTSQRNHGLSNVIKVYEYKPKQHD